METGSVSKKSRLKLNIGGPSVILLFTVLALALFAVLSVRAAYGELKLARRSYEAAADFYAADVKADQELFKICEKRAVVKGEAEEYDIRIPVDELSHIEMRVLADECGVITVPTRKYMADPVDGYAEAGFEMNNMLKDGMFYDD